MSYKPLKKTVRFSEEVRNNPNFSYMKTIVKACGDKDFKNWLLVYIDSYTEISEEYNMLISIKNSLEELVTREVKLDEETINYCKSAFSPTINAPVIELFEQALSFFCELQQMEKAIQKVSESFVDGSIDFTKSGGTSIEDAVPRNAQKNWVKYK